MTAAPTSSTPGLQDLVAGLCDDAAIFPPGNLPLTQAVPAHREHLASDHAGLVGPFIVSAAVLGDLAGLVEAGETFEVALTVPDPRKVADALATADGIPGLRVVALEVAVPDELDAADVLPTLTEAVADREGLDVFVELPRDPRRPSLVEALSGTPFRAKLRTGGVRADLYPDERELAEAVVALVDAGLQFKATAGLHHALRNTDPTTKFEQHGFLNLLVATDVAQRGGDVTAVEAVLAERDPQLVASWLEAAADRAEEIRGAFRSFGTCSVVEPRDEMAELGLPTTFPLPSTDEGVR